MQRRNKVGGILDRRFGENDPTMAPEDKMLERFAREKQRIHKKNSMFDLEDEGPEEGLTHMGKTILFEDEELVDDFEEEDLENGYDSDVSDREVQRLKRLRSMASLENDDEEGQPERKKTKKEVMEELIAKSKLHKYERQAAKEDDDGLRMQLDKELQGIQHLLSTGINGAKRPDPQTQISTIAGVDRNAFERNFDLQVRQLALDKKAKPADRMKTDEEKAEEESERLKTLEDKRQKRMMGEDVSDSDEEEEDNKGNAANNGDAMDIAEDDDEDDFGLGSGIKTRPTATELGFDDEDDFVIEDDLVASGSDLELDSEYESDEDEDKNGEHAAEPDYDDDEFTKGLLNEMEARNPVFNPDSSSSTADPNKRDEQGVPYSFPCPQSSEELTTVAAPYPHTSLPSIVQRIRAQYHPKLDSRNKEKLASFSVALIDFIGAPWDSKSSPPFTVLETLIRHIHSLAKMFPIEIAKRFQYHLEEMGEARAISLQPSDLILLTAIGSIFPTSDHFHQVVTPAILTMTRYLGQRVPQTLTDYAIGTYLSILSLQYQQLSKRFVPEVVNFTLNTICAIAPVSQRTQSGGFPLHEPVSGIRVSKAKAVKLRQLNFLDCVSVGLEAEKANDVKIALLDTSVQILDAAAELWTGKGAFLETFDQAANVFKHLSGKACRSHLPSELCERVERVEGKLSRMFRIAQLARRPLELHHHRPLAIKTYIPKFEETFDPDKHYDPDRDRAELAKLKAEHKKERKGAMRELRKDANFMAREKLRVKKVKDEAYEKKYKRLIAEIQSEEGREANAYERESKARKRANNKK